MIDESGRLASLELSVLDLYKRLQRLENCQNYVTAKELAGLMKCSVSHVYKAIHSGKIKTVNVGGVRRIPMSQFDDNLLNNCSGKQRKHASKDFMENLKNNIWQD